MLDVQKKRGTAPPNAVPTLIEQSNLKKYLETLGVCVSFATIGSYWMHEHGIGVRI